MEPDASSSFNPSSAHLAITLQMWSWVTLKVPDLSKCACDEVDVTAVSVGQGPAGCVCWWQRPVFNIYLNRNAISSLMWLDPIWQWSLSPVFLPSVILIPPRDLKGLKITAPRFIYIMFYINKLVRVDLEFEIWDINEAKSKRSKSAYWCVPQALIFDHIVSEQDGLFQENLGKSLFCVSAS